MEKTVTKAPAASANIGSKATSNNGNAFKTRYMLLIGLIVITAIGFSIANENFYSLANIGILLRSIAVLFLVSMAMTYIMLTAGIDLSVGSNVAFSGGVGVIVLTTTGIPLLGFIAAIVAGVAIGSINGFFVGKLKLSAFMITLATMALARGLALVIYEADSIDVTDSVFLWLGGTSYGSFPVVIVFVALVYFALSTLLYRTAYGRDVYSVGSNEDTAYVNGRRPQRTIMSVYMLGGLMAGLAAVVTVGRVSSGQPWACLVLYCVSLIAVFI